MNRQDLVDKIDPTKMKCVWCGRYVARDKLKKREIHIKRGFVCINENECWRHYIITSTSPQAGSTKSRCCCCLKYKDKDDMRVQPLNIILDNSRQGCIIVENK